MGMVVFGSGDGPKLAELTLVSERGGIIASAEIGDSLWPFPILFLHVD